MDEIRNPYERWMVRSNLERIERGEADPAAVVATLRAGGYERVAAAVEEHAGTNPVVAETRFTDWTVRKYRDGTHDAAQVSGPGLSPGFDSFRGQGFERAVRWLIEERGEELSAEEAVTYLEHDGGRVPCSRYGRDGRECAPIAAAVASIVARETEGGRPTIDELEHAMGLVVNDHDDPLELIGSYGTQEERALVEELLEEALEELHEEE